MIGRYPIEIGEKEFLDGITSSPYSSDGGFSPETNKVSITSSTDKIGLLYQSPTLSDISTNLSGNIIASASDNGTLTSVLRYFLTDTGNFYSMNLNFLLTLRQTGSGTFTMGNADLVQFRNELFATSDTDVVRLTGSTLSAIDNTWWSSTRGHGPLIDGVRHPMIVWENNLWIADDNNLHKWDGTTSSANALALSTEQSIVALGIDPSSGKMLISITEGSNASGTIPKINKVLVYDGFSLKPLKAVIVDEMVTAFQQLGGTVFAAYGTNLGYWTGAGVNFLRKLNISYDVDELIYKHKITTSDKTLLIAEGEKLLAMEDVIQGQKRFYYMQDRTGLTLNGYLNAVCNLGAGNIAIAYQGTADDNLKYFNKFDTTRIGKLDFYSKRYKMPRPVYVRQVYIEYADGVLDNTTPGTAYLIDQAGNSYELSSLLNDSGETKYDMTCNGAKKVKFKNIQLRYVNNTDVPETSGIIAGISRFIIYYDIAE